MNKKRFIWLILITLSGYFLLSWFGILTGILVYFLLNTIYSATFFKREVIHFLHSAKSLTLSRKQKILLTIKYLCAKCYPFLDDYSLSKLLRRLKLSDIVFNSIEISFLGAAEANLNKIFESFSDDECRYIFICFLGLGSHINGEQAHSFLLGIRSELPESVVNLIVMQKEYDRYLEYYQVLDLEPGSKPDTIKKQYKKLALSFHPDTSEVLSAKQQAISREAFMKIKTAYNKLLDLYTSNPCSES
jgi:hypothetical protein